MGTRNDRGRALARYIQTRTGVPYSLWDLRGGVIELPPPYGFSVITDRSLQRFSDTMRALPESGLPGVIRYDGDLRSIHEAWASFRLDHACVLIEAHANTIRDRLVKGE